MRLHSEGKVVINKEISDAQLIADSILAEARKKANAIVEQAQNQAAEIMNQAIVDAENSKESILADSKTFGYDEGYAEGKAKITEELEELVLNVHNFAQCKFDIKKRIIKSLHNDILSLILEISERICKTELQENREILLNVVENAISMLKEKESVTIIVNPEMSRKIYEISEDLKERIHNLEHIKIIEDTSVAPDGTIVEAIGSRVDARVGAQIEQYAHKLFKELNSTSEEDLIKELADVEGMNDLDENINTSGNDDKSEQI